MRSSLVGFVAFSLLTAFAVPAAAADPVDNKPVPTKKKPAKKKAAAPVAPKIVDEPKEPEVEVASASIPEINTIDAPQTGTPNQPPPNMPSFAPTQRPADKDIIGESSSAPPKKKEGVDPTGFVMSVSIVMLAPVTPLVDGGQTPTMGGGIEIDFGGYFSEHVGIIGGLRATGGHMICHDDEDSCNGVSVQLPVMLQVAQSRNNGLYGEAGLGFLTAYLWSAGDASMKIWTPAVLRGGFGYRVGNLAKGDFERKLSVDIHAGVDVGRMTNYSFEGFDKVKDGSGTIDNPSVFVSGGITAGIGFSL